DRHDEFPKTAKAHPAERINLLQHELRVLDLMNARRKVPMPEVSQLLAQRYARRQHAVHPPRLAYPLVSSIHQLAVDRGECPLELLLFVVRICKESVNGLFQSLVNGGGDLCGGRSEAGTMQQMARLAGIKRIGRIGNERLEEFTGHGSAFPKRL